MLLRSELAVVQLRFVGIVILLVPAIWGCGQAYNSARESARKSAPTSAAQAPIAGEANGDSSASRINAKFVNLQETEDAPRKIIYEAEINLVVDDVSAVENQIASLLKEYDGYVAESAIDRTQGEELSGRWRVRIPVEHFDAFLDAVSKLGVAENRKQTAQDVTEEFVDLEAQISNKKKLEERIVELVSNQSGEIKDVIEVERELARVRGEIEQMEGRLRYLTNRTELTTVSIAAREVDNYVPPKAPSFTAQIRRAWTSSLESLQTFGQQAVVAAVYAFPWIVVAGIVLVPGIWYVRKRR
jgi:uncharacterized coiled-coil protein SlyX